MKLSTTLAAAAALVLTACENPVQPPLDGALQPSASSRSVAADRAVHIASHSCVPNWDSPPAT